MMNVKSVGLPLIHASIQTPASPPTTYPHTIYISLLQLSYLSKPRKVLHHLIRNADPPNRCRRPIVFDIRRRPSDSQQQTVKCHTSIIYASKQF